MELKLWVTFVYQSFTIAGKTPARSATCFDVVKQKNRTACKFGSGETPNTSLYDSDPTTKDMHVLDLFNLGEYTPASDLAQGFLFLFEISFRRALSHSCHHIFVTRFLLFLLGSFCGR
jgi:hypothetical protein